MSPILNDSIARSLPLVARQSVELNANELNLNVMDFSTKRIVMDTTYATALDRAPAPLAILGETGRDFSNMLGSLRAELAPNGLVEALMVDRIVLAVSRLRDLIASDAEGEAIAQAEQSIDRAMEALSTARSSKAEGWGHPAPASSKAGDLPAFLAMPSEIEPISSIPAPSPSASATAADDQPWRDRLIFDENVSDDSPVVRGTWVTAGQVVSMIVDGASRADILRNYPELTERDIDACLAYTVEQDGPISF